MSRFSIWMLVLVSVWSGCAEEGGSRGSGISSAIEGNVAAIERTAGNPAASATPAVGSDLEGITVSVEGTNLATTTDAAGRFSLRGAFDGPLPLAFRRAADALLAHLEVKVPAGGTLTLKDVHIDAAQATARAAKQEVQYEGIVTEVDCAAALMKMVSAHDDAEDPGEYAVRLDSSTLQDHRGLPLGCDDLRRGQSAGVQATVFPDGSFGDALIQVSGP